MGGLLLACALGGLGASAQAAASSGVDPLEAINRPIFEFNEVLDSRVLRPIARSYADQVHPGIRQLIGNVFSNLNDPWVGLNNLLQGKPVAAISDFARFAINTVFCFGGLGDLASELGLSRHNEDLGQTLGVWGVPSGPYLVLPLFGPSSVRDAVGTAGAIRADPLRHIESDPERVGLRLVRLVDTRASLLAIDRMVQDAALDRYSFVRNAFLQRRLYLTFDGNPPEPADTED
jgi:phospholipid-binding lipoprotein MlaA